ncbi:CRP/FNR family cyclic AMP-dependent transcriptional regulator [Bradyrhizobium sp. LM4.3]
MPQDKTGDPRQSAGNKLSVLRKHPIFADLEPDALDQLCRYAKHTMVKRGATIAAKGDPGNNLFAVIAGTVKISSSSPDGRNAILNLIGPGEIFGEIAVLDGAPRSADATANTNCELYIIDRRDFLPFVKSQPALAMKFIELLCARLRWTSQQVEQVILQDLPGRLASALLGLTEERKLDSFSRQRHAHHHAAGDQRDGGDDAREHQQAIARLGRSQLGSPRARRHRRARH